MLSETPDNAAPCAKIHPNASVEHGAQIGSGCVIHAHASISRHCILGARVEVHPFAVLGGPPQDLSADPSVESTVRIGSGTVIREHVTVNRGSRHGNATEIGSDCFIMAAAHVAHDCQIGGHVVIANAVLLGGHVHVAAHTFLGGAAIIHQHGRIGEGAMIGGGSRISEDVPPYCLAAERNVIAGLNLVGLRRRGFKRAVIADIKRLFHIVYRRFGNPREIGASLLEKRDFDSQEAECFLAFFRDGSRRVARPRYDASPAGDSSAGES